MRAGTSNQRNSSKEEPVRAKKRLSRAAPPQVMDEGNPAGNTAVPPGAIVPGAVVLRTPIIPGKGGPPGQGKEVIPDPRCPPDRLPGRPALPVRRAGQ